MGNLVNQDRHWRVGLQLCYWVMATNGLFDVAQDHSQTIGVDQVALLKLSLETADTLSKQLP